MRVKGTLTLNIDLDLDGVPGPSPEPTPEPEPTPDPVVIPNFPSLKNGPLPTHLLTADSEWYRDISGDPVDPASAAMLEHMSYNKPGTSLDGQHWIHPDFGGGSGIPYSVVGLDGQPPLVPIGPIKWADESDKLDGAFRYPIPLNAAVETASDKHCLVYDASRRLLFELFNATPFPGVGWKCSSASIWDIAKGDDQRPLGHTSCNAAGTPHLTGLLKYDEVKDGNAANHALLFTTPHVDPQRIASPARHWVSVDAEQPSLPMLGTRVRLKASFDTSKWGPVNRGILETLKKHGMILVDRSGSLGLGLLGTQDARWVNGGGGENDVALLKAERNGLRNAGFLSALEVVQPKLVRTKGE